MEKEILVPEGVTWIPFADIITDGRDRTDFGDLDELSEGIRKFGLIHPPTVTRRGDEIVLVAGERRCRAMQLLGMLEVPVLFREEMTDAEIAELEIMENLQRKEFTWQETACNIYKIHRLREAEAARGGRKWGFRDTQHLTGHSLGHISHSIQAAKAILRGDTEVLNAPSLVEAYTNVLLKRREHKILEKLQALGIGNRKEDKLPQGGMVTPPSTDVDDIFGDEDIMLLEEGEETKPAGATELAKMEFPISEWFKQGDCIEIMQGMSDACVDHIVTDPPYGVDMRNMGDLTDVDSVRETHDVKQNLEMLPKFLEQAYRLLKTDGYCVFWYDLDHHEKLQGWAKAVGFKVQRWPITWHKMHGARNNVAQYNWPKDVEWAMVCRKGSPVLTDVQTTSVVMADGSIERQLYSNPFAKPATAWEFILKPIGLPGQIVLDPFAGQFSCPRTVLNLGMKPWAIEIDKMHFAAGVDAMKVMLNEMTGGKASFI